MALGLAIIFGQMGVINMAHGEFMTIGAYTTCCRRRPALSAATVSGYFFVALLGFHRLRRARLLVDGR